MNDSERRRSRYSSSSGSSMAHAVESFREFAGEFHTEPDDPDYRCLQAYIGNWAASRDVAAITGGNYETYLKAVIQIVDAYIEYPDILAYRGSPEENYQDARRRSVEAVIDTEGECAWFLDRQWWDALVWERAHSTPGSEQKRLP